MSEKTAQLVKKKTKKKVVSFSGNEVAQKVKSTLPKKPEEKKRLIVGSQTWAKEFNCWDYVDEVCEVVEREKALCPNGCGATLIFGKNVFCSVCNEHFDLKVFVEKKNV